MNQQALLQFILIERPSGLNIRCRGNLMPLGEKNRAELRTEAVDQRCSVKKVFLEISKISHINTCARGSFSNKFEGLRPATLLKKSLWHKGFSREFCEISKNKLFFQNTSGGCFRKKQVLRGRTCHHWWNINGLK